MPGNDGYYGSQQPENTSGDYNAIAFVIRSILAERNHVALVKVVNVDAPGGLALAGTVDVQPLVNQLDGQGNAIPHGVVNGLPYVRAQGGMNAIILDPQVGDIGLAVFCDRDISSVQAARDFANPASARRSDMADGVYIGGLLNAIPSQYVMFTNDGIKIVSPQKIVMQATEIDLIAPTISMQASSGVTITTPKVQVNGDLESSGTITGDTDVIGGGKSLKSHKHTGVASGTSTSGPPQ